MPRNSRVAIEGLHRLYHEKLASDFSKCACGKTDGDDASPYQKFFKNSSKILREDSQTALQNSHTHIVPLAPTAPHYQSKNIAVHPLRG